ncbi:hypothetical protein [Robertmurraya sp. P23]|uniref:hypothetical protein n=1 Tax=Robertmurraya sp. P23 TaxID=3436931 RepID=UPI003D9705C2
MTDLLLNLIDKWGIGGILFSLFIEGSAFPFVGTFFIVTVGFILDLSWFEVTWISLVGSFLYALGSYIPYTALTMLGIGPSTLFLLSIGRFYDGDAKTMVNIIAEYQIMLLVGLGVMTIGYMSWKVLKQRNQKRKIEVIDR